MASPEATNQAYHRRGIMENVVEVIIHQIVREERVSGDAYFQLRVPEVYAVLPLKTKKKRDN